MALTLSARRKSVSTSTTAGKAANSSGLCTNIATSSTSSALVMLSAISMSSTTAGSGTTSITTIMHDAGWHAQLEQSLRGHEVPFGRVAVGGIRAFRGTGSGAVLAPQASSAGGGDS